MTCAMLPATSLLPDEPQNLLDAVSVAMQVNARGIVVIYAGASGAVVDALAAQGVQGLIVASTGNGSVHHELEVALLKALTGGVVVVRATRCTYEHVTPKNRRCVQ